MKDRNKKAIAMILVCIVGILLLVGAMTNLLEPGEFPKRKIGDDTEISYREALELSGLSEEGIQKVLENKPEDFGSQSISQQLLERVPSEEGAGSANTVTGILWDYRGYDTVGEATVIFTAVAGVVALFRASKEEEENE